MRLHSLDYLRGLAAVSIMLFHYFSFNYGELDSGSTLGRLGIYGVSIFYILSGLTLYWNYSKKFHLKEFALKRIFRIFPLLWLATLIHAVLDLLSKSKINYTTLLLNLTGTFGFVAPDKYIAVGAWSIGNELVFYALFPFMLLLKSWRLIIYALLFWIFLSFASIWLDPERPLYTQWLLYINPIHQSFLFMTGLVIGAYLPQWKHWYIPLILGVTLFIIWPASGDHINIVTGINRVIFTSCAILVCYGFYSIKGEMPRLHKPLQILGNISYSVYFLHPIVWRVAMMAQFKTGIRLPSWLFMSINIVVSLVLSFYVYKFYEKWFMRKGAQLIARKREVLQPA